MVCLAHVSTQVAGLLSSMDCVGYFIKYQLTINIRIKSWITCYRPPFSNLHSYKHFCNSHSFCDGEISFLLLPKYCIIFLLCHIHLELYKFPYIAFPSAFLFLIFHLVALWVWKIPCVIEIPSICWSFFTTQQGPWGMSNMSLRRWAPCGVG